MLLEPKKEKRYTYLEAGIGRPLLLLHGLMGGLSNFNHLVDYFSTRGYRLLVPQLPLYSLPLIYTSVPYLAKYVYRFIKQKELQEITLVGNSLGGHIALVLAQKDRDLFHSMVLTGSSGLYEKSFGESFPKRGNYEYVKRKTEAVFYDPRVATKQIVDDVYATVNDRMKALKTLTIARSAIKHNLAKDLPSIDIPTCLIWGCQDHVTPPSVAKAFHELLPNNELFWIDNCGHAPMMEHPKLFNEILEKWLLKQVQVSVN